jgi:hypothetical protein
VLATTGNGRARTEIRWSIALPGVVDSPATHVTLGAQDDRVVRTTCESRDETEIGWDIALAIVVVAPASQ